MGLDEIAKKHLRGGRVKSRSRVVDETSDSSEVEELRVKKSSVSGQALLPVVIMMAIFLILAIGLVSLSIGGLLLSFSLQEGEEVLLATEGALEEGLIRVLRNPAYAGGSLQVGGALCTIGVSGSGPTVMTASCGSGRAIRRLRAEVDFVAGEMMVRNIREIE